MRPANRLRPLLWLAAATLLPVAGVIVFSSSVPPAGADEQATRTIQTLHGYRPWFQPLWAPPTASAEAGLFFAQAAAGAVLLALAILRLRARRSR